MVASFPIGLFVWEETDKKFYLNIDHAVLISRISYFGHSGSSNTFEYADTAVRNRLIFLSQYCHEKFWNKSLFQPSVTSTWKHPIHISGCCEKRKGVVSHIPKFGDASKSPVRDTASPVGDAASPSEDAVVSHWRCISYFRDTHPPHSHPHLPREIRRLLRQMWSHLQITGYVTLLTKRRENLVEQQKG
jgi:hypothetical protein